MIQKLTQQSFAVHPLIAVVGAKEIAVRSRPPRVQVVDARRLRRVLTRAPAVYEIDTVTALTAVLDDPGTWTMEPEANPKDALTQFYTFQASVRSADVSKVFWVFGLGMLSLIAGGLALWAVTAYISGG